MSYKLQLTSGNEISILTDFSKNAFDSDINVGASEAGGPPGYDSVEFYSNMAKSHFLYSFFDNEELVGGAVVYPKDKSFMEIGRIFINPQKLHQGYGMKLMTAIENNFAGTSGFVLDTPIWNKRTNNFYQKLGYKEINRDNEFVYYKKVVSKSSS